MPLPESARRSRSENGSAALPPVLDRAALDHRGPRDCAACARLVDDRHPEEPAGPARRVVQRAQVDRAHDRRPDAAAVGLAPEPRRSAASGVAAGMAANRGGRQPFPALRVPDPAAAVGVPWLDVHQVSDQVFRHYVAPLGLGFAAVEGPVQRAALGNCVAADGCAGRAHRRGAEAPFDRSGRCFPEDVAMGQGCDMTIFRSLLAAFLVAGACSATGQPIAYVSNEKTGTLTLIDTARDAVVGEIRAGTKPRGMALSRDGRRLYVSDQPNNALLIIDVEKRALESKIDLGESPEGVSLSPDGKWVAAAVEVTNSIAFVDTATGKVAHHVKTQGKNPEHAVFSPDGRWVYVSAEEADTVDVIDMARREQVASVKVGGRPRGIAFTPDGKRAYVACELANTVYAIDATKHAVLAAIPAGNFSNGVTMRPDGARVFISNGRDASVSVIDTATNAIIATVKVGNRPWNMAITPDGAKLYVANGRSNSVSVIDARSNAKLADIAVGELPWGVVIR